MPNVDGSKTVRTGARRCLLNDKQALPSNALISALFPYGFSECHCEVARVETSSFHASTSSGNLDVFVSAFTSEIVCATPRREPLGGARRTVTLREPCGRRCQASAGLFLANSRAAVNIRKPSRRDQPADLRRPACCHRVTQSADSTAFALQLEPLLLTLAELNAAVGRHS